MSDENSENSTDHTDDVSRTPAIPLPDGPISPAGFTAGGISEPDTAQHHLEDPPTPTPPRGYPPFSATEVPGGTYALGALAGNPNLGSTPGSTSAGQPIDPNWAPPFTPATPASRRRRARNSVLVATAACVALVVGVGIGHAAWKSVATSPVVHSSSPAVSPFGSGSSGGGISPFGSGSGSGTGSSGPKNVSAIAQKVDPGLVDINTTLGYQQVQAAGTGMVLTPSGEVLTNNHVIDGATTISVTDVGNGNTYSASVVGYDRTHDIAVLQLHNASGLKTATIGNSSNVAVGQDVVGIGNAGGTGGPPSAAGGTVTALNRSITASDEGDGSSEQLTGLIATNADIQAGDSGGPLVNSSGQVIGIDTAASAGFSFQSPDQSSGNNGFAIPINEATSIARQIESGNASNTVHIGATAFLGVEIQPTSTRGSGFGGFGGGTSTSGAEVAGVVTSSPAQEAGLSQGDVITSADGKTVGSPTDLTNALEPHHPGDKVTIGWTDTSGQSHTAKVQLSSGPPQ